MLHSYKIPRGIQIKFNMPYFSTRKRMISTFNHYSVEITIDRIFNLSSVTF